MEIKRKHINNFDIKVPSKSAFAIDTPPDIPKMHSLIILSGKRGGGKSVAITNFVKKLLDNDLMDRVVLLSPTYYSNKETYAPLKIKENDIIEPSKGSIKLLIGLVEAEKAEWDEFLERKKLYKQFKNDMEGHVPIQNIHPELMLQYHNNEFFQHPPTWKYKKEVPPRVFIIIDDSMGTDLMKPSSGLLNFIIKHRHIGEGLGVSVAMLVQSYACHGGLKRAIRENTCLLGLFKATDENQVKKIIQEMGDVDEDRFRTMFEYATSKPFGFLLIDFNPKDESKKFRANFNEYLY